MPGSFLSRRGATRLLLRMLFRAKLWAYPRQFRRRYGVEMRATFERRLAELRSASRPGRWIALGRLVLDESREILTTALSVRRAGRVPATPVLAALAFDVRSAFGALRSNGASSAVTVAILAFGYGASTLAFTVVHGVLVEPLPYEDPERIVQVLEVLQDGDRRSRGEGVSLSGLRRWRRQTETMDSLAIISPATVTFERMGESMRVRWAMASPELFDVLRIAPRIGRLFHVEEQWEGADPVALISSEAWDRYFGSRPLEDMYVNLDEVSRRVVGVLPRGFSFPDPGIEFWVPFTLRPYTGEPPPGGARFDAWLTAVGRLANHATRVRAQAEAVTRMGADIRGQERVVELRPLQEHLVRQARPAILALAGAVAFVWLIACTSCAGLGLARAARRTRELAIRTAVGASRGRILRTILGEAMLLALASAVLGVGLATAGLRSLQHQAVEMVPRIAELRLALPVLYFGTALAVVTGLVVASVPLVSLIRADLHAALAGRPTGWDGIRGRRRLVRVAVGLSVSLLLCATLLARSLATLASIDPGYDTENLLAMQLHPPRELQADGPALLAAYARVVEAVQGHPEVRGLTLTASLPSGPASLRTTPRPDDLFDFGPELPMMDLRIVDRGHFAALGIRLLDGRFPTPSDVEGAPVAVVSRAVADILGDGGVGKRLDFLRLEGVEIIGVVADVPTDGLRGRDRPTIYALFDQLPERLAAVTLETPWLITRLDSAPLSRVEEVRALALAAAPGLAMSQISSVEAQLAGTRAAPRLHTLVATIFAGFAVVLAVVGLYALCVETVRARRREIGVRRALGGSAAGIALRLAGESAAVAVGGTLLGLPAAWLSARSLRSLLYGVEVNDPRMFLVATVAFWSVAVLATWWPARAAGRVQPVEVLRVE